MVNFHLLVTLLPLTSALTISDPINHNIETRTSGGCKNGQYTVLGRTCHQTCGTAYSGQVYKTVRLSCYDECYKACAKDQQCLGSHYQASSQRCSLMRGWTRSWRDWRLDGAYCEGPRPKVRTSTTTKCTTKSTTSEVAVTTTSSKLTTKSTTASIGSTSSSPPRPSSTTIPSLTSSSSSPAPTSTSSAGPSSTTASSTTTSSASSSSTTASSTAASSTAASSTITTSSNTPSTTSASSATASSTTTSSSTTVAAPVQTTGSIQLGLDADTNFYGGLDSPSPNDFDAYRFGGYTTQAEGDTFTYQPFDKSFILSRSTSYFAPQAVGSTLYFDPINAAFGPGQGAGHVSWAVAVSDTEASKYAGAAKVSCEIDAQANLQCAWGTGQIADVWTCNGVIALVQPGFDASTLPVCRVASNVKLYDFKFLVAS